MPRQLINHCQTDWFQTWHRRLLRKKRLVTTTLISRRQGGLPLPMPYSRYKGNQHLFMGLLKNETSRTAIFPVKGV